MATDSTSVIAFLGAWRDGLTDRLQQSHRHPIFRVLRLLVTAGLVAVLAVHLTRIGWEAIYEALPTHLLFYAFLPFAYVALPVTEVFIYKPLWELKPATIFLACSRKRVLNEEVLGYSGEVSLYLWATGEGVGNSQAFRTVRDVNIVSSAVSFAVAGVLVGVMAGVGALDLSGWIGGPWVIVGAGLVVLAGLILLAIRFRRYVFALPRAEAVRVARLHFGRHVATNAMLVTMWHFAQPGVSLGVWLTFAAVLVVVERLPFLPSKDLVFIGASLALSKTMAVAAPAMAGMLLVQSAVFKLLHLAVLAVTSFGLHCTSASRRLTDS